MTCCHLCDFHYYNIPYLRSCSIAALAGIFLFSKILLTRLSILLNVGWQSQKMKRMLDSNIDGPVTGNSSTSVMGMTMEFCTLLEHPMVNTRGLILFWQSQGKLPSQLAAPTQDTLIPRFWSQEPTREHVLLGLDWKMDRTVAGGWWILAKIISLCATTIP